MKVVVCGSYGDLEGFRSVLETFRKIYGSKNVFPTEEHLVESSPCIEAHHQNKGETEDSLELRAKLMQRYFEHIDKAGLIIVVNEKHGKEHYGTGTAIEIGYAYAKGKTIRFARTPKENANIVSLLRIGLI